MGQESAVLPSHPVPASPSLCGLGVLQWESGVLEEGARAWVDQDLTYTRVPDELFGGQLLRSVYRAIPEGTQISIAVPYPAVVYLLADPGGRDGGWKESLRAQGWEDLGQCGPAWSGSSRTVLLRVTLPEPTQLHLPATTTEETIFGAVVMTPTQVQCAPLQAQMRRLLGEQCRGVPGLEPAIARVASRLSEAAVRQSRISQDASRGRTALETDIARLRRQLARRETELANRIAAGSPSPPRTPAATPQRAESVEPPLIVLGPGSSPPPSESFGMHSARSSHLCPDGYRFLQVPQPVLGRVRSSSSASGGSLGSQRSAPRPAHPAAVHAAGPGSALGRQTMRTLLEDCYGRRVSDDEFEDTFAEMDADGSGDVDVQEFAMWTARRMDVGPMDSPQVFSSPSPTPSDGVRQRSPMLAPTSCMQPCCSPRQPSYHEADGASFSGCPSPPSMPSFSSAPEELPRLVTESLRSGSASPMRLPAPSKQRGAAAQERPCPHNDWDSMRTRNGVAALKCRQCAAGWRTVLSNRNGPAQWHRCSAFDRGECGLGADCPALHVHRRKQPPLQPPAAPA